MLDKKLKAFMVVGVLTLMSSAPAFSQAYNPQQQYNQALQQSAVQNAMAQDAWAARTVPGMYPGGYNDGTKSYNFDGSITPNGYGLTPSLNGFGGPVNPYANNYNIAGPNVFTNRHGHGYAYNYHRHH